MRKSVAVLATVAIVSGLLVTAPIVSATALSSGVHFSAENLPTWQTNGVVYAVGHANGRVVAGGEFSQLRPPTGGSGTVRNLTSLAILDADTGAPTSCQLPALLTGGTPSVRAITTSPDGDTVYVGGNFSSIGGVTVSRIAAIDPVACTVRPFRVSVSSTVLALAVTEDTVYLGGQFTTVGSQPRQRFAAVNSTTGALRPWVADVELPGRAVTVSPDRTKVVIGGDFFTVNGQDSHSIGVVDAVTGANVRNYPVGFIPRTSVTKALSSDATGFYGGNEGSGGGAFDGSFAIDWDTLEQRWRDTCLGATQAVLPYEGTLYEANHHHDCGSMNAFPDGRRMYFTAQSTDDPTLLGWFPTANDGTGEGIGPRALVVATGQSSGNDYLWAGGEFTVINGAAQQGLTRFGTTDTGAPPVPPIAAEALTSGAIQVRFRTVVDPDDSLLTYSVYRNGATTPIWTETASSMWWVRPQVTFVDTTAVPGTLYSYRVRASDGVNVGGLSATASARAVTKALDYAGQVIADGPALYWRYDEPAGVWAHDKSGPTTTGLNGLYQNGMLHSAAGAIAGDTSTAGTLDGVDDYVISDQLRPAPTSYTIETWFNTGTTTGGKIVGYGNGRPRTHTGAYAASRIHDREVYMENSGQIEFGVNAGGIQTIRTAGSYNDNQWHHLVATQGPAGLVLYIDGVQVGSNPTTTALNYQGTWRVGGDSLNGWPNRPTSAFFAGAIDETAIYDYPLSSTQVVSHYQLGGGTPPETVAPSVPTALAASVSGTTAALSWSASTDNVAVTGYQVYRGTSAGFVADASSKIADTTGTSYSDSGLAPGAWFYRVTASDAAGNTSAASAAVTVTVAAPPDTEAPSVPTALVTSVSGATAALSWSASTDNVAVTGYEVYRGTSAGFVADASSKIADTTGTSYSDPGVAAGTWFYRVTASDAAGNVSGATEAVAATVTPVVNPVVLTVSPDSDAMVYRINPTTNYGSDTQLSSRGAGGNSPIESYLKFTIPAAPAGTVLSAATIRVRTSGDPAAGSLDSHTLQLVTGEWDEATVIWNNRPTGAGAALGTLSGATATNTPYTVPLNVAELSGLAGSTQSFALVSAGVDNLRLWSNNAPSATYRPLLTLTYTAP